MGLATLGPFNLPVEGGNGYAFTIVPAGQFSGPNIAGQLLLTNNSGYIIQLTSSQQGQLPNLNPGMVTAIAVPTAGGSLEATIIGGSATVSAPQVTCQFGVDGETFEGDNATFPGAYPFSIPLVGQTFRLIGTIAGSSGVVQPDVTAVQLIMVTTSESCTLIAVGAASGLPLPTAGAGGMTVAALPGTPADQAAGYRVEASDPPGAPIYVYQSETVVLNMTMRPEGYSVGPLTGTSSTVGVPAGTVALEIVATASAGSPSVVDGDGAALPVAVASWGGVGGTSLWWVPLSAPGVGGAFTVTFGSAPDEWIITALTENPFLGDKVPSIVITALNPPVSNDWSFTMPFNGRLVSVQAELNPSGGGASNRFPYLWLDAGSILQLPMSAAAVTTASGPQILNGFIGAGAPFQRSGDNRQTFPLPADLELSAGMVIESATGGLTAGDEWISIVLTFSVS